MTLCFLMEAGMEPIPTTAKQSGHLYYPCSKKIGVIALLQIHELYKGVPYVEGSGL
jgi:hypothetical protein